MIAKQAIDEFLNAPVEDWTWIKDVPKEELNANVKDIYPDFDPRQITPYKHQLASLLIGMSQKEFLFFLDMSLGKAQPVDSKIITPNGYRLMKELSIGDLVVNSTGNYSKIVGIFPQGTKEIFKVSFTDGTFTECCDDHLWEVYSPSSRSRFNRGINKKLLSNIVSLKSIRNSLTDKYNNLKYFIPVTKPVNFIPVNLASPIHLSISEVSKILNRSISTIRDWDGKRLKYVLKADFRMGHDNERRYYLKNVLKFIKKYELINTNLESFKDDDLHFTLHPYLLGVLLGDGCIGKQSISITIGKCDEAEMISLILNYIPKQCKLTRIGKEISWSITALKRGRTNLILERFRELGLLGKKSPQKWVPEIYKYSSIEDRLFLLQGLLDTDGYVMKNGTVTFSSSSKQLTQDVIFLVQSLGGTASYWVKKTDYLDSHSTTINLPKEFLPFRFSRKKNRCRTAPKFIPTRGIKSVESVGFKEAQCIKLGSKDGLYLTNDFIVTHNTLISLWMLSRLKSIGKLKSALIVVPNVSVINSWGNQIRQLSDLKVIELFGTMVERGELLKDNADLFIINYTALQILLTDIKAVKKYGKPDKNKWVPSPKKIKEFSSKFNVVIFDEIHYCKDKGSLNFKLANKLTDICQYRYGLTGTPFGRDPEDLWSQFYLIDKGATMGTSLGLFREAFFTAKANYWGGIDYKFKKELQPLLQKKIQNKSIRYKKDETDLDLPPKIYNKVITTFSIEATQYQKAVADKYVHIKGNLEELKNSFMKFRQISAGFLKHKTDEGEEVLIRFKENPKLDALKNLILSAPHDAKFVIFNEFIESGNMIEEMLKELKIKHIRLYSGTSGKIKKDAENLFNDPSCKGCLANSQSGSLGLNLQAAWYTFFYERSADPITNSQAEERVHRPGQTRTTFIYDIIMQHSVDEKIHGWLKEGKDLKTALLDYQKELSGI